MGLRIETIPQVPGHLSWISTEGLNQEGWMHVQIPHAHVAFQSLGGVNFWHNCPGVILYFFLIIICFYVLSYVLFLLCSCGVFFFKLVFLFS